MKKAKDNIAGCLVMTGMFLLSCDNLAVVAVGIIPLVTGAALSGAFGTFRE